MHIHTFYNNFNATPVIDGDASALYFESPNGSINLHK